MRRALRIGGMVTFSFVLVVLFSVEKTIFLLALMSYVVYLYNYHSINKEVESLITETEQWLKERR